MTTLKDFVEELANYEVPSHVDNQYADALQRHNLYQYLKLHSDATILLLGEAAGYKGCFYSGIPFTSGHILATHPTYTPYRTLFQFDVIKDVKEQSAAIVHDFFLQHTGTFERVVLWNAYPFHPHKYETLATGLEVEHILSNRTPTYEELLLGAQILTKLQHYFHFTQIYPVGKSAEHALDQLHIRYQGTIRHPANGGKPQFWKDLERCLNTYEIHEVELV
jgi:hypothetical protein